MYHLELRQFPHVARIFNLGREELDARFVRPWVTGSIIEHDERRWAPDRVRLKILEGRALRPDELGMGRGWATASRACADVTEAVMAEVRRGARAHPEVESLKAVIEEVAAGAPPRGTEARAAGTAPGGAIGFADVMALAAAAHPGRRVSEQLAIAEQAVWEMLHQQRLEMTAGGEPVGREAWQGVVLSWATWAGTGEPVELRLPVRPGSGA
ncbi:MAG TPA: hypothetical protein VFN87_13915 [Solirubrobacteraceae bacterium]|nr:hypothetical protein [Solirubrobacteraceae bacterium]